MRLVAKIRSWRPGEQCLGKCPQGGLRCFAIIQDEQQLLRLHKFNSVSNRDWSAGWAQPNTWQQAWNEGWLEQRHKSTNHTPSAKLSLTTLAIWIASRVLPLPPEPVSVDQVRGK